MVNVLYCTGVVHTGAKTVTYSGGGTDPDLTFQHQGHAAVQQVVTWLGDHFTHVPKLISTG